jgi:hypothetical protein
MIRLIEARMAEPSWGGQVAELSGLTTGGFGCISVHGEGLRREASHPHRRT